MEEVKKSIGQRILNVITTILVILVVIAAILLMGARVMGLQVYTIISGSMKPTYQVGDLIYVKKAEFEEIQVGDPISFVLNEDLVVATHRVVEVDTENQRFFTKGDSNAIRDVNPVYYKNVIGKPVFRIPYLGYVSAWVKSPPGLFIAIGAGIILLGLVFIPDLFHSAKVEELKAKEAELKKREEALLSKEGQTAPSDAKANADTPAEAVQPKNDTETTQS